MCMFYIFATITLTCRIVSDISYAIGDNKIGKDTNANFAKAD